MPSKFNVFQHNAKPLTEIDSATTPRSWILNDVGRCEFSMSLLDPKTTESILQYGNLVHVVHIPTVNTENDVVISVNGQLPDWTGVILPPRVWNSTVLNCAAYSAEALLTFRPMPFETISGTPAVMFKRILELANQAPSSVTILPGRIEDISKTFTDDLRNSAYEHIVSLIKKAGMTWSVTGEINKFGNLELYGNLTVSTGIDTNMDLNDLNSELRSPIMTEQGTPYNAIVGYSFAHTQRGRYSALAINQSSLADYGFFGKNMTFMGLHDPSSVDWAAQQQADTFGRPPRLMSRTALDFQNTFDHLDRGNYVNIVENGAGFAPGGGFGFSGKGRILAMDYNDLSNKVDIKGLELIYG
jgi:hypothetical protein